MRCERLRWFEHVNSKHEVDVYKMTYGCKVVKDRCIESGGVEEWTS